MSIKLTVNRMGLKLKKHSPEILMVAGVVGTVTAAVLACRATRKMDKIVSQAKADVEKIHDIADHPEDYDMTYETDDEINSDLTKTYVKAGVEIAKVYAPAVILGAVSLSMIIGSNNILKKRNAALGAAYVTLDQTFKKYRKNVVDKFGTEVDKELRYGIKEQKKLTENGEESEETVKTADIDASDNAKWFDSSSAYWENDAEYNLWFLKGQQSMANDKLTERGYLFLNEVLKSLGIPETKAGQVVGWVYDPNDTTLQNHVDFGIYDISDSRKRAFVNTEEPNILLDFNIDGNIWNLLK